MMCQLDLMIAIEIFDFFSKTGAEGLFFLESSLAFLVPRQESRSDTGIPPPDSIESVVKNSFDWLFASLTVQRVDSPRDFSIEQITGIQSRSCQTHYWDAGKNIVSDKKRAWPEENFDSILIEDSIFTWKRSIPQKAIPKQGCYLCHIIGSTFFFFKSDSGLIPIKDKLSPSLKSRFQKANTPKTKRKQPRL